jgi:hypoxanthine phosphoribosyltransferase
MRPLSTTQVFGFRFPGIAVTIELTVAIVGATAAAAAFVWMVLGNPSIPALVSRARKRPRGAIGSGHGAIPVEWETIEAAVRQFVADQRTVYDLIVGVQPDGVMMATLIAQQLGVRQAMIEKRYEGRGRKPFFVFHGDSSIRSERKSASSLQSPVRFKPESILLVDGVATFGNSLVRGATLLKTRYPSSDLEYFVYAVDEARLSASHPELLSRLKFGLSIDNRKVWLVFPWDQTPEPQHPAEGPAV